MSRAPLIFRRGRDGSLRPSISLSAAMRDPELFGATFAEPTFWPWLTVAKLIDGEPLDARDAELFRRCTGRTRLPTKPVRRMTILVGRRGGKDRFKSAVAVWRAALAANWRKHLSRGEVAVVTLLGADKAQALILRRYCEGLLDTPLIAREVVRQTGDTIEFRNGAALQVGTNDVRLIRGRSAIAVLGSECCFWRTDADASSSDEEVVAAAEPSMAMCHDGGMLILGSSVYRRRGYMFRKWKELHGADDAADICWLAPSRLMNPVLPQSVVDKALADDPARARAEYMSEWRSDIESFVSREVVEACVSTNTRERPPAAGVTYHGFVDPSGGSADSMTLAITHRDGDAVVLDAVREARPPFSPEAVVGEFATLLKSYGLAGVTGDRYGGEFCREPFRRFGIDYDLAAKTKSDLYRDLLPAINSALVDLLNHPRLINQLCSLERRTARGGKDSIDHAPGAHDDLANVLAGAVALCAGSGYRCDMDWVDGEPDDDADGAAGFRRARLEAYLLSGGTVR